MYMIEGLLYVCTCPEINIKFEFGGCNGGQRSDIDAEIENHVSVFEVSIQKLETGLVLRYTLTGW